MIIQYVFRFPKNIFWTLTDCEVPSRKIWNGCLNSPTYMKYLLWKGNTKVFFNKVYRWYFVQKVTFCPLNTTENISLLCKCYYKSLEKSEISRQTHSLALYCGAEIVTVWGAAYLGASALQNWHLKSINNNLGWQRTWGPAPCRTDT